MAQEKLIQTGAYLLSNFLDSIFNPEWCEAFGTNNEFFCDLPPEIDALAPNLQTIETQISYFIVEDVPIKKREVNRCDAIKIFANNNSKLDKINKIREEKIIIHECSHYRDLCVGPLLSRTGKIKKFVIIKKNICMNYHRRRVLRIYACAFGTQDAYNDWRSLQERLVMSNARKICKTQELYFKNMVNAKQTWFYLIFNKLQEFLRSEYRKREYNEIISPDMYSLQVWRRYWDTAKLISFEDGARNQLTLKSKNFPGPCLMFKHRTRSYQELPIRLAEFTCSQTYLGLRTKGQTHQDNATVFCQLDQIGEEVKRFIELVVVVYSCFGFKFSFVFLSRNPASGTVGPIELWDVTENLFRSTLKDSGYAWEERNEALPLGPSLNCYITDANQRTFLGGSFMCDYILAPYFALKYTSPQDTEERPIVLHQTIFSSIERFFTILIEHTCGEWPFWINPKQLLIIPIAPKWNELIMSP